MAKMGRPTKCTPELTERFAEYMARGLYLQDAADLCHIGHRTAYDWLERGDAALLAVGYELDQVPEDERPFAEFSHTVRAEAAGALDRYAAIIEKAADGKHDGDWRAAAWFLEHRRPDTWGKREQKHEHTGEAGGPVQIAVVPVHGEGDPMNGAGEDNDGSSDS